MGEFLRTVQFLQETNKGENTFKFWSFVLNREKRSWIDNSIWRKPYT